jgi:hypothetical protein
MGFLLSPDVQTKQAEILLLRLFSSKQIRNGYQGSRYRQPGRKISNCQLMIKFLHNYSRLCMLKIALYAIRMHCFALQLHACKLASFICNSVTNAGKQNPVAMEILPYVYNNEILKKIMK